MRDRKTKRIILFASVLFSLVACTGNVNNNTPLLWITQLESTSAGETQGDQQSLHPQITPDGRYIVFASDATNLLNISPTPPARQIYRKDLITREIILVSVNTLGNYAEESSDFPSISDDGRYVVFESDAQNLISGFVDNNESNAFGFGPFPDVFLRDVVDKKTYLVSCEQPIPPAAPTPYTGAGDGVLGLSGTGQPSSNPMISGDGKHIVFESKAKTLKLNSLQNDYWTGGGYSHVFLVDVQQRINNETSPAEPDVIDCKDKDQFVPGDESSRNPYISQTGKFITFETVASNLVDFLAPPSLNGEAEIYEEFDIILWENDPGIDLRFISGCFAFSTNQDPDPTDADCLNPSVSDNGTVVFESASNELDNRTVASPPTSQIYLWRYTAPPGPTLTQYDEIISVGGLNVPGKGGDSTTAVISQNGQYVSFLSQATNLSSLSTGTYVQVFSRDRTGSTTTLVSIRTDGDSEANSHQQTPYVIDSGGVVFSSDATNLVHGDDNFTTDIYFRYRDSKP
ncbi:MAG: hypothetical protein QF645_03625 [Planctomycetota bacterium]|nr:hypothetical protein [Planctomycetota bacterium]